MQSKEALIGRFVTPNRLHVIHDVGLNMDTKANDLSLSVEVIAQFLRVCFGERIQGCCFSFKSPLHFLFLPCCAFEGIPRSVFANLHSLRRGSIASAKNKSNWHRYYTASFVFLLYTFRPCADGPFKRRVAVPRLFTHFDQFFLNLVNDTPLLSDVAVHFLKCEFVAANVTGEISHCRDKGIVQDHAPEDPIIRNDPIFVNLVWFWEFLRHQNNGCQCMNVLANLVTPLQFIKQIRYGNLVIRVADFA